MKITKFCLNEGKFALNLEQVHLIGITSNESEFVSSLNFRFYDVLRTKLSESDLSPTYN